MPDDERLTRNVVLYRRYQALRSSLFWLPVFFLYFNSIVDFADVLALEALYYACVVALEVPSGWFSDRFGRRLCLVIGASFGVAAHVVFALADGFATLAVAQALLAGWMAFNSGSDTSLLYDSLRSLGREDEFARVEGNAHAAGFAAGAAAAGIAGLAAGFDLRIPYVLTAVAQVFALVAILKMTEPPSKSSEAGLVRQISACVRKLSNRALRWALLFTIAVTILNHVPYELYQKWLEELARSIRYRSWEATPAISAAIMMGSMMLGAVVSRGAARVAERVGAGTALVGSVAAQTAIIAVMGAWLHPLVVVAILFRSAPGAIQTPLLRSIVHPRLPDELRSTFFSMLSLAGRLGFSITLLVASLSVGGEISATWTTLASTLFGYALLGLAFTLLLAGLARSSLRTDRAQPPGG